jgi:hypothetical protein
MSSLPQFLKPCVRLVNFKLETQKMDVSLPRGPARPPETGLVVTKGPQVPQEGNDDEARV